MQGADQILEMERMAAKGMQRGQMEDRGLSAEQISAYIGDETPSLCPMHTHHFESALSTAVPCVWTLHSNCAQVFPATALGSEKGYGPLGIPFATEGHTRYQVVCIGPK